MSKRSPAFQFYAGDFLAGTLGMSATEVGVYVLLLLWQWEHGGEIDDDLERLRWIDATPETVAKVLSMKFDKTDRGTWQNARLEQVYAEQQRRSRKATSAANKRWQKPPPAEHAPSIRLASPEHMLDACSVASPEQCTSSSSSSSTSTSSSIEFEIDHRDMCEIQRRYAAMCLSLSPQNAGDRLLSWRACVLSVVAYSENWLYDAIQATKTKTPVRNRWAYLTRCLREAARAHDRDFDADCKRCPPLPKKANDE